MPTALDAFRPMRIVETDSAAAFAGAAADWLCDHLVSMPEAVLALPTGNTPLKLYAELIARSQKGAVSFNQARIFNLDEYCGLGPSDPRSFGSYLHRHLITPLGLSSDRVRLLQGDTADAALECRAYDAAITAAGGIDLCVLGLGANGHIAFNEPGTPWSLRTHVAELSESTRSAQRRPVSSQGGLEEWKVPERGLTMGIATLLEARQVLLMIAGTGKEQAMSALLHGQPDIDWPVTSLAGHPGLTVIRLR